MVESNHKIYGSDGAFNYGEHNRVFAESEVALELLVQVVKFCCEGVYAGAVLSRQ